ncbi:hypothetical protein KBC04_02075 [Candidatus Babeliales bacterium]|nr:hypothetical protein [Candidatus Babeliales bacterium]MBP9843803.1 hypothetical protein [Candidatus Babeliales bacterium]
MMKKFVLILVIIMHFNALQTMDKKRKFDEIIRDDTTQNTGLMEEFRQARAAYNEVVSNFPFIDEQNRNKTGDTLNEVSVAIYLFEKNRIQKRYSGVIPGAAGPSDASIRNSFEDIVIESKEQCQLLQRRGQDSSEMEGQAKYFRAALTGWEIFDNEY